MASIRKSVVFPVPVPPLISRVFPLRICSAKKSARGLRQRAASNQIIDRVMAAGEFPDRHRRGRAHNRRNHRRKTASIRELRVQY